MTSGASDYSPMDGTELEMLARLEAGLTDGFPGTDPSPPPVQDHRKTFWERVREIFTCAKGVD